MHLRQALHLQIERYYALKFLKSVHLENSMNNYFDGGNYVKL